MNRARTSSGWGRSCRGACAGALIAVIFSVTPLASENTQYPNLRDEGGPFTPFSDFIPKSRLHNKTVPHYLEDYYLLYGLKMYYNEDTLRMNIARLKTALASKFRHPSEALVKIDSEDEYSRYRNLMFMHLNMLIMRSYLGIAARYDKRDVKFYNQDWAKEIAESLDIAATHYREALPYWEEAVKYAEAAGEYKITTNLGFIENERYRIVKGELDFGKIIENYLEKLDEKKGKLGGGE
ncbi:MAG: hypothetical protein EPN93_13115 [Spirochaetes bacterium]|nr:MAG: hypothetical protein EPN93_13115 [Spirochaetota bacterium]